MGLERVEGLFSRGAWDKKRGRSGVVGSMAGCRVLARKNGDGLFHVRLLLLLLRRSSMLRPQPLRSIRRPFRDEGHMGGVVKTRRRILLASGIDLRLEGPLVEDGFAM